VFARHALDDNSGDVRLLTFCSDSMTRSRAANMRDATPMTNGMSWPVVRMVWTPDIPDTRMVFSMNKMKQVIVTKLKVCIAR
jgi:hypothetical protein